MSQGPEEPSTLVHRRLDRTQLALLLVAFWVGFNLRAPILGVPPVLALVRRSDHLSYAVAGLVSAVPILALGLAALPGAALVRRLGAFKVVAIGLAVAAVGELARALPGGVATLLLATAVMGSGIAITQPGLPAALQRWFGPRVQLASVTLTLGITVGEVVAAGTTSSLVLRWLGSWQGTMAFWGVLGATCVPIWLLVVPRDRAGMAGETSWELRRLVLRWRPWAIYALFAGQSLVFFSANTWIPISLGGGSHSGLVSWTLATLNGVMVPVDVLLLVAGRTFATRRWFYVVSSAVTLAGAGGWLLAGQRVPILCAALIGIGVAMTFAGLLAFPAMVVAPSRVAALAATMLTVGYASAFLGPLLGGVALDLGGGRSSPFIPIVAAATVMLAAALVAPVGADPSGDAGRPAATSIGAA